MTRIEFADHGARHLIRVLELVFCWMAWSVASISVIAAS